MHHLDLRWTPPPVNWGVEGTISFTIYIYIYILMGGFLFQTKEKVMKQHSRNKNMEQKHLVSEEKLCGELLGCETPPEDASHHQGDPY